MMKTLCRVLAILVVVAVGQAQSWVVGNVLGASPGAGTAMAVIGDLLCLGSGQTLYLEDLNDPQSPMPLGSILLAGEPSSIALKDSVAYVGLGHEGWGIVDIHDPTAPQIVYQADWPLYDYMLVKNGYLFALQSYDFVHIYSLEDPLDPDYSGLFSCDANWIAVNESHLFVEEDEIGIHILELQDSADPVLVGTLAVDGSYRDRSFAVTDSYLINCGYADSIRVYGLDDPSQVTLLSTLPSYFIQKPITTIGNHILISTMFDGVLIVDVTDGTNPEVIDSLSIDEVHLFATQNSLMYFMDHGAALYSYDLSDMTNPVLRGETFRYYPNRSFATLGRLTLSAAPTGIHLEDFSDPEHPRWLGRISLPGIPRELTLVDSVAFVGTRYAGLQRVDLRDLQHPILIPMDNSGYVTWMGLDENILNLLYDTGFLRSIDVSDPGAPTEVRSLATDLSPWYMTIEGQIACEYDDFDFRIWDIGGDTGPVVLFEEHISDYVATLHLHNNLLYRTDDVSGLRILDLHDPANPIQLGSLGGMYQGIELQHEGDRLYFCDGDGNISVIDVQDPSNPVELGRAQVCLNPVGIRTGSGLVFVPTLWGGIWALRFPGLFPPEPAELAIATRGPDVMLTWEQPEAAEWNVYRLVSPFELPGPANRVATVSTPAWTDTQALGLGAAFYRVTAVVE